MAAGAAAERSPCEFKPAFRGASELMQPGSEAVTTRPTNDIQEAMKAPATPILGCATIRLAANGLTREARTLADLARAGARGPYCEHSLSLEWSDRIGGR